jgi:hypothetical protein
MYLPDDPAGALTPWGDLHNHAHAPGPCTPALGWHAPPQQPRHQLQQQQQQPEEQHEQPQDWQQEQQQQQQQQPPQQPPHQGPAEEQDAPCPAGGHCWGDGSLDVAAGAYKLYARARWGVEQRS